MGFQTWVQPDDYVPPTDWEEKQVQPTGHCHSTCSRSRNNPIEVTVQAGQFSVPKMYDEQCAQGRSRWDISVPPATTRIHPDLGLDPRTKAALQQGLHEKDKEYVWMPAEEKMHRTTKVQGEQGKAIIVALQNDNAAAVSHAFGLDGAHLLTRIQNSIEYDSSYGGISIESDCYAGYPLFVKTSDGERTAMDGARGKFGTLKAGSLDSALMEYEVGDTALDIAVRNKKWLVAAALVQIQVQQLAHVNEMHLMLFVMLYLQTDHPLNVCNQGRENSRYTAINQQPLTHGSTLK
jgi:hypothetical protein